MCGIFASIGLDRWSGALDRVAHRGPDGEGWAEFASPAGKVVLGHRRLSIFDLSPAGQQPMADRAGRYHLVFNGAIYNFHEIRTVLEAKGIPFHSRSDTEVLLHALAYWGLDALARLRGMFAFVFWDDAEKRLLIARDRFGIKPLYFRAVGGGLVFGSEIKQLVEWPGHPRPGGNAPRIRDFLSRGMSDHTGETLFESVMQLRGGECMAFDLGAGMAAPLPARWYRPPEALVDCSEGEAAARFGLLFADAVRTHLVADVEVGSCLSGGLDSSAIVAEAARRMRQDNAPGRLRTLTAGYEVARVDERAYARMVAEAAGVESHAVLPHADDLIARMAEITWQQDEPFGSTSIFAQFRVFEEARRLGIKVMLDGQGADELLAGYHAAFPIALAMHARSGRLGDALALIRARRRIHGASITGQMARFVSALLPAGAAHAARTAYRRHAWHDWLRPAGGSEQAPEAAPRDLDAHCRAMTASQNLPMLLHWEDRNSMAHGIEARVPFLDHPLAEFLLSLGNAHKISGIETKRVLRLAMRGLVPDPVLDRQDKLGFATPESEWARGPMGEVLREGVEIACRRFPGILRADGVRALAAGMLDGRRAVDPWLWRVVNLGVWAERFSVRG